jgi:hypothetical protein
LLGWAGRTGKMAFFDTISTAIGSGTFGATLAAATYAGAAAIEKDASSVAKQDIAKFLKSFGDKLDISLVSSHISSVFDIIFGKKHWSKRCFIRSASLTLFFCVIVLLATLIKNANFLDVLGHYLYKNYIQTRLAELKYYDMKDVYETNKIFLLPFVIFFSIITAIVPVDYISLWKSRVVLRYISNSKHIPKIIFWTISDYFLSLLIFTVYLSPTLIFGIDPHGLWETLMNNIILTPYQMIKGYRIILGYEFLPSDANPQIIENYVDNLSTCIFMTSTILTSIWTLSIFCAALSVRLAISLKYPLSVITWLFDIDEHPIKIIGMMLALFIWIGYVVYAVI